MLTDREHRYKLIRETHIEARLNAQREAEMLAESEKKVQLENAERIARAFAERKERINQRRVLARRDLEARMTSWALQPPERQTWRKTTTQVTTK